MSSLSMEDGDGHHEYMKLSVGIVLYYYYIEGLEITALTGFYYLPIPYYNISYFIEFTLFVTYSFLS